MLQVGQSRAQLGDSFRLQSHEGAWNPTDHAFRPPTLLLAINLTTVDFRAPLLAGDGVSGNCLALEPEAPVRGWPGSLATAALFQRGLEGPCAWGFGALHPSTAQ